MLVDLQREDWQGMLEVGAGNTVDESGWVPLTFQADADPRASACCTAEGSVVEWVITSMPV